MAVEGIPWLAIVGLRLTCPLATFMMLSENLSTPERFVGYSPLLANVSVEGKPVRYRRGPAAVIGNGVSSNSRHCPEPRVGRLEAPMARKPEDLAETTT